MLRTLILTALSCSSLLAQKLAVMETAFGNRGAVESIALTKKAGFQGVQIHTGKLDANGVLTLSIQSLQREFRVASKEHDIEIISLCAGSMNRINVWKARTRPRQGTRHHEAVHRGLRRPRLQSPPLSLLRPLQLPERAKRKSQASPSSSKRSSPLPKSTASLSASSRPSPTTASSNSSSASTIRPSSKCITTPAT